MTNLINSLKAFFALLLAILLSPGGYIGDAVNSTYKVDFVIDASQTGEVLGNKVSNANLWSPESVTEYTGINEIADISQFVEYIQLMQATGGSAQRDLFIDPYDNTVLDDYDFSPLISACKGILNVGAKPHIKTGNVPLKFTENPNEGYFGVNIYPPDNYDLYYNYIYDIAQALVEEFGLSEVQTWRFGVLTEYENESWFTARSGKPYDSMVEYCKLYDYTVAALEAVLGNSICVGAHSMTVSDGLWDERQFIEHCANGINYKTGEKGSRINFLAASFYDKRPGHFSDRTLPETIDILRNKAESVGLNSLIYGIDEGRILSGNTSGSISSELLMRTVGDTYQAAYDARLIKQMVDHDIDYFSSWGYSSGGLFSGYPTVGFHVAERYSKMADANRLEVSFDGRHTFFSEIDAVAGLDEQTGDIYVMAYNFRNDIKYKYSANMTFTINVPNLNNETVTITQYMVDDDANYFDEWRSDRNKYGITDDCFGWSPDDSAIDTEVTLRPGWARDLYYNQLREVYIEASKLVPSVTTGIVADGKIQISTKAAPNAVVFYVISPI